MDLRKLLSEFLDCLFTIGEIEPDGEWSGEESVSEFFESTVEDWVFCCGCNPAEGIENEAPVPAAGVGDLESVVFEYGVSAGDEVEVDGAWCPCGVVWSASEFGFDLFGGFE